jgi:hypothetical protein
MIDERLQAFGQGLARQRDDWVRSRYARGLDKRWVEDIDQYNAKDFANRQAAQMMEAVEQGYPVTQNSAKPTRSTVYIGLTRQKANGAEARLSDILLPTDDRNWGIKPTPIPTVAKFATDHSPAIDPRTGQTKLDPRTHAPLTKADMAKAVMKDADTRSEAMQTRIDDQLVECDYNAEVRRMIHDATMLGTGVLKGPVVMSRVRKAWMPMVDGAGQQVHVLEVVKELNPVSMRVDPRNVWPDPACGESVHNGKGIFERQRMTSKQVRELAKQPGYLKQQLREVIEQGPQTSATMEEVSAMSSETTTDLQNKPFEVWEYWGEIDKEDLRAAGVEVPDDELVSMSAVVVMINSTVVRAYLNPLETGDLPYDFYPWEKMADSVWGYGVPYLMRAQQRVLNAAWRQMMDNAGVSSGPQIVVKPSVIAPADKQWELTSRKIWWLTDESADARTAFATFEFNSHQAELSNIIKLAEELADQETGVPMLTQGNQGSAPDTVGGMQMLMNAANVVLRRLVKQFDDYVTKPHIRRYYDFNMMHSEDESIKGDFSVDARGSSALLVRDIQNQAFLGLLQTAANPVYGIYVDSKKLFERALQAQHIDPAEIFRSDEEIAKLQQQPPQQNPQLQVAQIRAQAEMQKAQSQSQADQIEMQTRMQMAREDRAARMAELELQRQIKMIELSQSKDLSLDQIKAKLADTAIKERTRKDLFVAEQRLKLATGSGL